MKFVLAAIAVVSLVSSAAFACPQVGSTQGVSYSKVDYSGKDIGDNSDGDVYFYPTSFMLIQSDCSLRMVTPDKTYELAYNDSTNQFEYHYQVAWFDYTLAVEQDAVTSKVNVALTRVRSFWQSIAPVIGYSADFQQDAGN